jgi:hypothetical protein
MVAALGMTSGTHSAAFAAPARRAANAARPDAALYREAQAAETRLRASAARKAKRAEWEAVVLRYRKVVARYPRSGYCDDALFTAGSLYREMAQRFRSARYREDAASAYRMLVAEYPSSRLGDDALWSAVEVAREAGDRRRLADSARAYLDTYPEAGTRRASRRCCASASRRRRRPRLRPAASPASTSAPGAAIRRFAW